MKTKRKERRLRWLITSLVGWKALGNICRASRNLRVTGDNQEDWDSLSISQWDHTRSLSISFIYCGRWRVSTSKELNKLYFASIMKSQTSLTEISVQNFGWSLRLFLKQQKLSYGCVARFACLFLHLHEFHPIRKMLAIQETVNTENRNMDSNLTESKTVAWLWRKY